MANNVVPARKIIINSIYRILIWIRAWFLSLRDIFVYFFYFMIGMYFLSIILTTVGNVFNTAMFPINYFGITLHWAIDIVKIVMFSTLVILFMKSSMILKREAKTLWEISTPRYEGYQDGVYREYNNRSILTEGHPPFSEIGDNELSVMKRRAKSFSIYSLGMYFLIQSVVWLMDSNSIYPALRNLLSSGVASEIIFTIIGIPIMFANIVNDQTLSLQPTPDTAVFFIDIAIPSIIFILGLRNRISFWIYFSANRAPSDKSELYLKYLSGFSRKILKIALLPLVYLGYFIVTLYLVDALKYKLGLSSPAFDLLYLIGTILYLFILIELSNRIPI